MSWSSEATSACRGIGESCHYRVGAVKTSPGRPLLRLSAVVLIAGLGVTACTSTPSAKRVAEDLINTLAETDAERDCMLEKVDVYSKDDRADR